MISNIPLTDIYLYFSSYCNLTCRHCWIDPILKQENEKINNEIELDRIIDAIEQAREIGLKTVKITGGEPFLKKNELIKLLFWLKSKNINTHIETNATLISDAEASLLKETNVIQVAVSLDGYDAYTHEKLRLPYGCYEKTINGIKSLTQKQLNVQIITCLWKGNINSIFKLVALAQDIKVRSIKFNVIGNIGRGEKMNENNELLSIKEYLEFQKVLNNEIIPKSKVKIFLDIPPAFKNLSELKNNGFKICRIKSLLGILADGTISICGIGRNVDALRLGNISENRIKDVWQNNSILRWIRESLPQALKGICAKCMMKAYCLGKCRAEAYWQTNSLDSPYPFCERAYNEGLFPLSRLI